MLFFPGQQMETAGFELKNLKNSKKSEKYINSGVDILVSVFYIIPNEGICSKVPVSDRLLMKEMKS